MATESLIERLRRAASPVLRRQLAAVGVAPPELRREDLDRVPVLARRDLDLDGLDDPVGALRLADAPSPVRLGASERDGVTVVLSWTARDLTRVARRGASMLRRTGIAPKGRVANTLDGGFATPGSLALGDALEALGALDVPIGPVRDERSRGPALDLLERIGVEVLVTDAATGGRLVDALSERRPSTLRRIVWTGDSPPPHALVLPVMRWVSIPEVSVFGATTCERDVLHLDPDARAEVVDGRLVLGMPEGDTPLFRVESGLCVEAVGAGCACGEGGAILLERKMATRI